MSPVNNDDSPRDAFGASGRQLTRKEIRAREKALMTQSHQAIPPQAFETARAFETPQDRPAVTPDATSDTTAEAAAPAEAPARAALGEASSGTSAEAAPPPGAPQVPTAEASSDAVPPVHAPELPAADPTVHEDIEHAPHEYAAGHAGAAGAHFESGRQHGHAAHHGAEYSGHGVRTIDEAEDAFGERPDYHHEDAGYGVHEADAGYGVHEADAGYDVHEADAGYDHHEDAGHDLVAGASTVQSVKGPSKKVRRRRRFLALVLTLMVFVAAVVVVAQFIKPLLGGNTLADYPGPGTGEVTITVPSGAGPKSVAAELQDKKVVASADSFLKEFAASGGALSPGDFSMRTEMKNSDAVAVLLNKDKGKVMYFALSAGLRIGESLQAISGGTGISVAELKALSDSPAQFGVPAKSKNLEGFLAPGEYRFPLGTTAKDILQKLTSTTLDELKAQGVTDPAKQYDVVTVASIVQAEGGQAEYGDVAGAIYNRLKPGNTETNGLIQSDATVTYGLGIRSFHIDEKQKADASNPYNTYATPGLPAGPIGSPGKTAIDAAAKPKANNYLYWVTINLDTKETKFSKTLAEHNGYVQQYNAWCAANPGRCV